MAGGCLRPSTTRMPHPGDARCPPLLRCAGSGSTIIRGPAPNGPGVRRTTSPQPRSASALPTTVEAHDARTHTTQGVDDNVQRTETGDDDLPHVITHGETTIGPAPNGAATPKSHTALQQRGLRPATPMVDTGVLDADRLVESRDDEGVELL